ncbi:hypothetical protein CCAN12_770100 [Capnocytophaga canimorsus]|uniref:Uncharacterized protein n=1 Tax=Capnocytophaga canimorsus TaxID=28188 RepID=A0A0B7HMP8_9FLAO|nr:hypothetical protein CCAN12_770100 [Capnocytophaga canimorsus]
MTARTKPLSVLEGQPLENQTQIISFEKPSAKKTCNNDSLPMI